MLVGDRMNNSCLPSNSYENSDTQGTHSLEQVENKIIERSRLLVTRVINKRGHDKPPFLSEEFSHLVDVKKILKEDLGELGGILLRYSDGYVIKVNKNHPMTRQNFSFFHEVGHILLDDLESCIAKIDFRSGTFNPQMVDRERSKSIEHLCDVAASELLMPENVFKTYLSDSDISINSLEMLARIFNTSIQTTAIRIAETSLKPCISMLWKQQPGNSNILRSAWQIGPGRKQSSKNRYYLMQSFVGNSSALYKSYQSNEITKCYKTFKTFSGNQRFSMESKGYGHGKLRHVISLVFPLIQKNKVKEIVI